MNLSYTVRPNSFPFSIVINIKDGKIMRIDFIARNYSTIRFCRKEFKIMYTFVYLIKMKKIVMNKFILEVARYFLSKGLQLVPHVLNFNQSYFTIDKYTISNFKFIGKSRNKIKQYFLRCLLSKKFLSHFHESITNVVKTIGIYKIRYKKRIYYHESVIVVFLKNSEYFIINTDGNNTPPTITISHSLMPMLVSDENTRKFFELYKYNNYQFYLHKKWSKNDYYVSYEPSLKFKELLMSYFGDKQLYKIIKFNGSGEFVYKNKLKFKIYTRSFNMRLLTNEMYKNGAYYICKKSDVKKYTHKTRFDKIVLVNIYETF